MQEQNSMWTDNLMMNVFDMLGPEEAIYQLKLHTANKAFYRAVQRSVPKLLLKAEAHSIDSKVPSTNLLEKIESERASLRQILEGIDEH